MDALLMPIVRDGRNRVDEYETLPPPAVPSGPVERRQASAQLMADFAAERAGAGERRISSSELAFNPTQDERPVRRPATPEEKEQPVDAKRDQRRIERRERILAAIRSTSSYVGAAAAVGLSRSSVEVFVSDLGRRGELPGDVAELLSGRNPSIVKRTALAEHRRAQEAAHFIATPATTEVQAPEAGVPATDALDLGTTGTAPAEEVATPPAPTVDGISLQLTLDVSAAEMATWRPERIALFFRGIATVTMARWAVEP